MKLKWYILKLFTLLAIVLKMEQPLAAAEHASKEKTRCKHKRHTVCHSNHKKKNQHRNDKIKYFKHDIQLQLYDSYGFPVEGTQFWTKLDIIKVGPQVTIHLPVINFMTGQISTETPPAALAVPNPPGGFLNTADGFLPECIRPNDLVHRAVVAPTNDGAMEPFSATQPVSTLPNPPAGYILQVTSAGAIVVQCAGTFGNIIPPGGQTMMPTSITYLAESTTKLSKNTEISTGATDITGFTNFDSADDGFRDTHFLDSYNGTVVFAWTDNSNIDQTQGTLNVMVAVGKIDKHGHLHVEKPVQITDLQPNIMAWDTSVAINRQDPNNIIVSYGLIDNEVVGAYPFRAISYDGGKTWPANPSDSTTIPYSYTSFFGGISSANRKAGTGTLTVDAPGEIFGTLQVGQVIWTVNDFDDNPGINPGTVVTVTSYNPVTKTGTVSFSPASAATNIEDGAYFAASPTLNGLIPINTTFSSGFGDNRGVSFDKYGNLWYGSTNFLNFDSAQAGFLIINQLIFAVSTDNGLTFPKIFTVPFPPGLDFLESLWDFPQFGFGGENDTTPGLGYGLYYGANFEQFNGVTGIRQAVYPSFGFIPIMASNSFGLLSATTLPQFEGNVTSGAVYAVAADGRVWINGFPGPSKSGCIGPNSLLFKSPGPLEENIVGPWQRSIANRSNVYHLGQEKSFPEFMYITEAGNVMIYDNDRQALYSLVGPNRSPDQSQDERLSLLISRDNGMTWSEPIDISTTKFANRGFASMVLDPKTKDLVFNWYDGRNDPTFKSVEFFAAVLPAKQLDSLVNKIHLSDPTFIQPAFIPPPLNAPVLANDVPNKAQLISKKNHKMKSRISKLEKLRVKRNEPLSAQQKSKKSKPAKK